jgi:hypothetical protein
LAQTLGINEVNAAKKYWLEQFPQTVVLTNLAAGSRTPVMPTLQGWNTGGAPDTYVELTSLGVSPIPNVLIQVVADGQAVQYRATEFPPELQQRYIGMGGVRSLSVAALNQGTTTVPLLQVNALFTIWRMPVAAKVMHAYPLTQEEAQAARRVRVEMNPVLQGGTRPIDIETIINSTYRNRRISPSIDNFDQYTASNVSGGQAFYIAQAYANQMLVVTSIAADAFYDDGVTITVDRDDDQAHVVILASSTDLANGLPMFVPALRTLAFKIQSVTVSPDAPIPVRIEGWRLSLSNILRVRLGLATAADLRSVYQAQGAQEFVDRVLVGVN